MKFFENSKRNRKKHKNRVWYGEIMRRVLVNKLFYGDWDEKGMNVVNGACTAGNGNIQLAI